MFINLESWANSDMFYDDCRFDWNQIGAAFWVILHKSKLNPQYNNLETQSATQQSTYRQTTALSHMCNLYPVAQLIGFDGGVSSILSKPFYFEF